MAAGLPESTLSHPGDGVGSGVLFPHTHRIPYSSRYPGLSVPLPLVPALPDRRRPPIPLMGREVR